MNPVRVEAVFFRPFFYRIGCIAKRNDGKGRKTFGNTDSPAYVQFPGGIWRNSEPYSTQAQTDSFQQNIFYTGAEVQVGKGTEAHVVIAAADDDCDWCLMILRIGLLLSY